LIAEFASGKKPDATKGIPDKIRATNSQIAEAKKLSQVDFAYMLDKEKQNYNKIEKGKSNTTSWTLYKIAELLEVPVQKLFDWE
jgi:DNA-binding XRE family transcriptional regulator